MVATKIVIDARRYDNDRDAEAALMINSETFYITSPADELYTLYIPSRPEKTLTNIIVDAERRVYLNAITVYYDDSKGDVGPVLETVAAPVFTPGAGTVTAGTRVEMKSATVGAQIYYTIDGTEPSSAALLYEAPVEISHDITLRAFAVADGMKPSAIVSADFKVRNPQATLESYFNFAEPETLNPAVAAPAVKEAVDLDGRTFSDGDVAVSFTAAEDGNTHVRLYGSYDAGTDLRIYNGDVMTIRSLNPAFVITGAEVTVSLSGANSDAWFLPSAGEWVWERNCWEPGDEAVTELALASWMQSSITELRVTLDQTSGAALTPAATVAPVYYNLQGVRVANPTTGLYIKLTPQGASKILIRAE